MTRPTTVMTWRCSMNTPRGSQAAVDYLRENFRPSDRLAVVLINKRTDTVIQRLTSAERLISPEVQEWLHEQNSRHFEVYVSMNALREQARGRTKADVEAIRHV